MDKIQLSEKHKTIGKKEANYILASFENVKKHLEKEPDLKEKDHEIIFIATFTAITVAMIIHISLSTEQLDEKPSKETLMSLLELLKEECLISYPEAKENYEALYERTT